jgi:hypothetical protein
MQDALVERLLGQIDELERIIADLERHNRELRETVAALLAPSVKRADVSGSFV